MLDRPNADPEPGERSSNSQFLADRIRTLEANSRYTPHLPEEYYTFDEHDYSNFDHDPVRPTHVTPSAEATTMAFTHFTGTTANRISGVPGTLEYRAKMHSEASLPPETLGRSAPPLVSSASTAARARNPETRKILESERLVADMRTGADAIAYFARTPDKAVVKIVYCAMTSTPVDREYNPYSLRVISREEAKLLPVYYTISQNGVLRVVNPEVRGLGEPHAQGGGRAARVKGPSRGGDGHGDAADPQPPAPSGHPALRDEDLSPDELDEATGDSGAAEAAEGRIMTDAYRERLARRRKPERTNPHILSRNIGQTLLAGIHADASEFVQLDRWILETSNFAILRNFRVFRDFYGSKSLRQWMAFRKYRKYCRNRGLVDRSMFTAKQHFLATLKAIWAVLYEIRETHAIALAGLADLRAAQGRGAEGPEPGTAEQPGAPLRASAALGASQIAAQGSAQGSAQGATQSVAQGGAQTLAGWRQAQAQAKRAVSESLDAANDAILTEVLALCTELRRRASDDADADEAKLPLFLRQKLLRTHSITATKAEQLGRRRAIRRAQLELMAVFRLITLCDALYNEAMLDMLLLSVRALADAIVAPAPSRPGLIVSEVSFPEGPGGVGAGTGTGTSAGAEASAPGASVVFSPPLPDIQQAVFDAVSDAVALCAQQTHLSQLAALREYFILAGVDAHAPTNIAQICQHDASLRTLICSVNTATAEQLARMQEFARGYAQLYPVWAFLRDWDEARYVERHSALSCDLRTLVAPRSQRFLEGGAAGAGTSAPASAPASASASAPASAPAGVPAEERLAADEDFRAARDGYGTRPLEREIRQFRAWSQLLARQPASFATGFAQLDARALLQRLQPVPTLGLRAVETTALRVLRTTAARCTAAFRTHAKVLSVEPRSLAEYTAYIEYARTADADLERLSADVQLCDDLAALLSSANNLSSAPPTRLFAAFDAGLSVDDLFTQDARTSPPVAGLGLRIAVADRSALDTLHGELGSLQSRRQLATALIKEQHFTMSSSLKGLVTTTSSDVHDVRSALSAGSACDANAEPKAVLSHLAELAGSLEDLRRRCQELAADSAVLTTWYADATSRADEGGSVIARRRAQQTPSSLVGQSNTESIAELAGLIQDIHADLETRRRMWTRMNEWRFFEDRVLLSSWMDTVVSPPRKDAGADGAAGGEAPPAERAAVQTPSGSDAAPEAGSEAGAGAEADSDAGSGRGADGAPAAPGSVTADTAADAVLDTVPDPAPGAAPDAAPGAPDEDALGAHQPDPLQERFGCMDAEACVAYIQEVFRDAARFARALPDDAVSTALRRSVAGLKQKAQLIQDLGNPSMRERHWEQVFDLLRIPGKDNSVLTCASGFSLENLVDYGVMARRAEVSTISATASGERSLELTLERISKAWAGTAFRVKAHTSRAGAQYFIVAGVEDLYQQLEDSAATLQAMAGSRFIAGIRPQVEALERRLGLLSDILDEWVRVQQGWLYLEAIFAPEDIRRQLPAEAAVFAEVDRFWQAFMTAVSRSPAALSVTGGPDAGADTGGGGGAPDQASGQAGGQAGGQTGGPYCGARLLADLASANARLEQVQKRLEDYLELKRLSFPRFFFLSNDELLAILAQTTDPESVRPFLRKIFEAVADLEFARVPPGPPGPPGAASGDDESAAVHVIAAMVSPQGERVPFVEPVRPSGALVEAWLTAVEAAMIHTLRVATRDALAASPGVGAPRCDWMFGHPAQCVLGAGQAVWARSVEEALAEDSAAVGAEAPTAAAAATAAAGAGARPRLAGLADGLVRQINELVELVTTDLAPTQRELVTTLIVLEVHSRDVTTGLADPASDGFAAAPTDFGWLKQLRYYWRAPGAASRSHTNTRPGSAAAAVAASRAFMGAAGEAADVDALETAAAAAARTLGADLGDMVMRQTNTEFTCGYEYMGVPTRLVLTPLTDRCYITLTCALHNFLGGAPQGPAGTGKTETTKDLAKAFNIQCLVFNCSEGLDVRAMGKFFTGLAMCGAWSCFDEFNRIDIEVLSVIAQQILTIQTAITRKQETFLFEGVEIPLNPRCGVFITMNPGYAGRVELPDNLKALFRPMSMVVPDYSLIAEIMLFAQGFATAKTLSRKMVQLYKLSSEQLSQQDHYDFGMRALKSVLVMAGGLKRQSAATLSEEAVLIRAMRDANVPKFLPADIELFMGIVQDLFPGVQIPAAAHGRLHAEVVACLRDAGLQPGERFVAKILQVYDTHCIRHGLMTVGDTLTGKTAARNTLAAAITNIGRRAAACSGPADAAADADAGAFLPVEQYVINAKAVTMTELYGEFNAITHDWTDGLVAVVARRMIDPASAGAKHWLCFDSPVDALWVENLNTTLDDNKMICLANGERIRLHDRVNIFFEVADLSQASPATVSRCGMVFFSEDFIGAAGVLRSLTADSPAFLDALGSLVSLEEFGMDLAELRDGARLLCAGPIALDEEAEDGASDADTLSRISSQAALDQGPGIGLDAAAALQTAAPAADPPQPLALLAPPAPRPRNAITFETRTSPPCYPRGLTRLTVYEQIVSQTARALCEKLLRQFDAFLDDVLRFVRAECAEELRTVAFQQVRSMHTLLAATVAERVAFARARLAEAERQRRASESFSSRPQGGPPASARAGAAGAVQPPAQAPAQDASALTKFLSRLPPLDVLRDRSQSTVAPMAGSLLDQRVIFAAAWGLAGSLRAEGRQHFDVFFRRRLKDAGGRLPELLSLHSALPPAATDAGRPATVFDWRLDNGSRFYAPWSSGPVAGVFAHRGFDADVLRAGGSVYDLIVPTDDFIRQCTLVQSVLRAGGSVFLCGATGTSKTSVVKAVFGRCAGSMDAQAGEAGGGPGSARGSLAQRDGSAPATARRPVPALGALGAAAGRGAAGGEEGPGESFALEHARLDANTLELPLSAQTPATFVEGAIVERLERRRKNVYGPAGQRAVQLVFVDDANMPAPDTYGSQPPIEVLRQIMSEGGCYDRQRLAFRTLQGLQFVCACQPPGGGRNDVPRRFSGKFVVLSSPEVSAHAMRAIFQTLISGFVRAPAGGAAFCPDVQRAARQSARFVVDLYGATRRALRATPLKSHYSFNIRDIARVVGGVFAATPADVPTLGQYLALLAHEAQRVFRDRLADDGDRAAFDRLLTESLWRHFGVAMDAARSAPGALDADGAGAGAGGRDPSDGGVNMDGDASSDTGSGPDSDASGLDGPAGSAGPDGDGDSDGGDASAHMTGPELAAAAQRLDALAGCSLAPDTLLFGRWANPGGTVGDGVPCPYRNLAAQALAIEGSLSFYLDSTSEAPEDAHDPLAEVDYEALASAANAADAAGGGPGRLVMFKEAVHHFSRVFRVLTQPSGHALLIGLAGSGRRSLVRLAAFAAGATVVYPTASRLYGAPEFLEDLKHCMLSAGCDRRQTILLLTEGQLDPADAFLETLNGVLNGVPLPLSTWKPEEHERILSRTAELAAAAAADAEGDGAAPGADAAGRESLPPAELWHRFYRACRSHFHVCLCLTPVGDGLRRRLRMFPALSSCMAMDWYAVWSPAALDAVVRSELAALHPALLAAPDAPDAPGAAGAANTASAAGAAGVAAQVSRACVRIHRIAEECADAYFARTRSRVYVTPPHFLGFLQRFRVILARSVGRLRLRQAVLRTGLTRLVDTKAQVAAMQAELTGLQPVLAESVVATERLLAELSAETEGVSRVRSVVQQEEAEVARVAADAAELKDDARRDLDLALPAFNAAVASLRALNKNDISEMKSFKAPPEGVKLVMEAVLVLLESPKLDWDAAQRTLGNTQFLALLLGLDKDNIKPRTLRILRKYTQNPELDAAKVEKVSKAAKSLCLWTKAIDVYARVYAEIAPKREKLAHAEAVLAEQQAQLARKQADLAAIEAKLAGLQASYDASARKRAELEAQVADTRVRLQRAERLVTGLASEHDAWAAGLDAIARQLATAVGDAVLGAGCIAYLGPFSADDRGGVLAAWMQAAMDGLAFTPAFALHEYAAVVDPRTVRFWKEQCLLPADQGSVEGAIIATQSARFPLFIDPESQCVRWLRRAGEKTGLQTASAAAGAGAGAGAGDLQRALENCIRVGAPLLVEDVPDTVDGALMAVLRRELAVRGGQRVLRLGDAEVEYSPDFRLYLATRRRQPNYRPDVQSAAAVVNMAVSTRGLEEQLLSLAVTVEDPGLERERDAIASRLADGRETLAGLQDRLLTMLASATGNILDDEALIDALQESKHAQRDVDQQVESAEATARKVDAAREEYRAVARRGRILYEAVAALAGLDPMYVYSLDFFCDLFARTLRRVPAAGDRLARMVDAVTAAAHAAVCRGLFERHKPVFALMLCASIENNDGRVSAGEYALLTAAYRNEESRAVDASFYELLLGRAGLGATRAPLAAYGCLNSLFAVLRQTLAYDEFTAAVAQDPEGWRAWLAAADPETIVQPSHRFADGVSAFVRSLTPFQQLLLFRAVNPARLLFYVPQYVRAILGEAYVVPQTFSMDAVMADATLAVPTVFILSPGTDPLAGLQAYAAGQGKDATLRVLSLGQGHGPIAERILQRAVADGDWVCLQNCHLCLSWMGALARFVEGLPALEREGGANPGFRLFLTSMPSPHFPNTVLAASNKVSREPPRGLKSNILLAYSSMAEELHDTLADAPAALRHWRRLLFGIAFFYSALVERRRFGPVAYNNPYEFSVTDMGISQRFALQYLTEACQACQALPAQGSPPAGPGRADPGRDLLRADITAAVPCGTLRYMVGVIAFGGRVTDSLDQRCISALLEGILDPSLFREDPPIFGGDPAYRAPSPDLSLASTLEFIRASFPAHEAPGLFGLHENAEWAYQQSESSFIVDAVIAMNVRITDNPNRKPEPLSARRSGRSPPSAQGATAASDTQDTADAADAMDAADEAFSPTDARILAAAADILERLPADLDAACMHLPAQITVVSGGAQVLMPSPLHSVLRQECDRYNRLLAVCRVAFVDVGRAIRGLAVMSPQLEDVYTSLLYNKLPRMVADACYPTLKSLSGWAADLCARRAFMGEWLDRTRDGETDYHKEDLRWQAKGYVPDVFWMGAFFFPHGFLTALMQHHARIESIPIDTLSFQTKVLTRQEAEGMTGPDTRVDGTVVSGLFCEGTRWDAASRTLQEPVFGQIMAPLPDVWFCPVTALDRDGTYAMPLYTTTIRYGVLSTTGTSTNYVLNMHLPTEVAAKHWILRGAAAFIQRSD